MCSNIMERVKILHKGNILFGVYIKQDDYSKQCGFTDMIKLDEPIYVGNVTSTMGLKQQTISVEDVEILECV